MALVNLRFEDPETAFVASQIANIIFNSLWFWSRALLLGCELRILLQMFLNLNPYFYPIYYVWQWTDPIFNFGRAWYPKLVGFDFTPMINFVLLAKVESFFDRKAHGVDKFNSWKYDQKKLVDYLKKGSKAIMSAISHRNTITKDTFMLTGFSDALLELEKRCEPN